MGAEDRFLVRVYRGQVADAAGLIAKRFWSPDLPPYRHVGEVEESSRTMGMSPSGWRLEAISTTRLAAWIPLLAFAGWVALQLKS
jgi:hypothetical protein